MLVTTQRYAGSLGYAVNAHSAMSLSEMKRTCTRNQALLYYISHGVQRAYYEAWKSSEDTHSEYHNWLPDHVMGEDL